ncbi:MAG: Cof-type HAD-IIB family hydrolase [Oscillospiraceae bacterium]|nr:Cof-type HAD-IIB family hydrolase [Oscillospiraceae bacterium]
MEKPIIFAFDLDGTMLNSKGKISPGNLEYLKKMQKDGVILIPTTGRDINEFPKELLDMGIDHAITLNGSRIINMHTKEVIWSQTIDSPEILQKAYNIAKDNSAKYSIYFRGKICDSSPVQTFFSKVAYGIRSHPVLKSIGKKKPTQGVEKIMFVTISEKKRIRLLKALEDGIGGEEEVCVTQSSKNTVDITPSASGKGNALEWMADELGVSPSHVIAVGDEGNDVKMLRFAGRSCAVENATGPAKQSAKKIIGNHNEDFLDRISHLIDFVRKIDNAGLRQPNLRDIWKMPVKQSMGKSMNNEIFNTPRKAKKGIPDLHR